MCPSVCGGADAGEMLSVHNWTAPAKANKMEAKAKGCLVALKDNDSGTQVRHKEGAAIEV